jgi:hypothetical protein
VCEKERERRQTDTGRKTINNNPIILITGARTKQTMGMKKG